VGSFSRGKIIVDVLRWTCLPGKGEELAIVEGDVYGCSTFVVAVHHGGAEGEGPAAMQASATTEVLWPVAERAVVWREEMAEVMGTPP